MWFVISIIVFIVARKVSHKINSPLINPLLICVAFLIALLSLLNVSFTTYYADNAWVSYFLQASVVALAFPLYEQLPQIRANWQTILMACGLGSVLSMLTAGSLAVIFGASPQLIAAILTKSVTTAIALEVSSSLGGQPAIAAVLVLIVGLFGSIFAYPMYKLLRITHPVAKGLTMGTVSHALGTATCAEKDPRDAAFSSLALVLCGLITSLLAPFFYHFFIFCSEVLASL